MNNTKKQKEVNPPPATIKLQTGIQSFIPTSLDPIWKTSFIVTSFFPAYFSTSQFQIHLDSCSFHPLPCPDIARQHPSEVYPLSFTIELRTKIELPSLHLSTSSREPIYRHLILPACASTSQFRIRPAVSSFDLLS